MKLLVALASSETHIEDLIRQYNSLRDESKEDEALFFSLRSDIFNDASRLFCWDSLLPDMLEGRGQDSLIRARRARVEFYSANPQLTRRDQHGFALPQTHWDPHYGYMPMHVAPVHANLRTPVTERNRKLLVDYFGCAQDVLQAVGVNEQVTPAVQGHVDDVVRIFSAILKHLNSYYLR